MPATRIVWIASVRHRLRQGLAALLTRSTPDTDALAGAWLSADERTLFGRMPAHDQSHAVRVARRLLGAGHDHRELIAAALLHDLAKAGMPDCPGRVRLTDRALRVILGRIAPATLTRLTTDPDWPFGRGLYLAVHHARLGAETARLAGSSRRTCWLIAHHEDRMTDDEGLRELIAADDATV